MGNRVFNEILSPNETFHEAKAGMPRVHGRSMTRHFRKHGSPQPGIAPQTVMPAPDGQRNPLQPTITPLPGQCRRPSPRLRGKTASHLCKCWLPVGAAVPNATPSRISGEGQECPDVRSTVAPELGLPSKNKDCRRNETVLRAGLKRSMPPRRRASRPGVTPRPPAHDSHQPLIKRTMAVFMKAIPRQASRRLLE